MKPIAESTAFYKTTDEKINDFVAEYGLPKSIIKPSDNNPCAFAIYGYYYLTIVAEDELKDLAKWLMNERLYQRFGGEHEFLMGAPLELVDECVKQEAWIPIIKEFYAGKAASLASRDGWSGYPNALAYYAVKEEVIEDDDLDRYFNSDGFWNDPAAETDLINKYVDAMTERAISHPCEWYIENKTIAKSRYDLRDFICKKKGLLNRKLAVDIALDWEMEHLGTTTFEDFLAKYFATWDGKIRHVGDFYAFFSGNPELLRTDPKTWTALDLMAFKPKEDSVEKKD